MGDKMAGKLSNKLTVMIDDESVEALFLITSENPDINTSEVVRAALLDCSEKFRKRPALIKMLPTIPTQNNQM